MRELKIIPKTVADQLGHSVDVDLNVYTKTAIGPRKEAVDSLESGPYMVSCQSAEPQLARMIPVGE